MQYVLFAYLVIVSIVVYMDIFRDPLHLKKPDVHAYTEDLTLLRSDMVQFNPKLEVADDDEDSFCLSMPTGIYLFNVATDSPVDLRLWKHSWNTILKRALVKAMVANRKCALLTPFTFDGEVFVIAIKCICERNYELVVMQRMSTTIFTFRRKFIMVARYIVQEVSKDAVTLTSE